MDIELSEDPRDFARRDWSHLVTADPGGTFFHGPRYLKLYWEEFGQDIRLLLVIGLEEGRTVGATAFELLDEKLRFLGGTEVTDYMGPVAAPGLEDAFAKELMETVGRLDEWGTADLRGLPEDSSWLPRLRDAAASRGIAVDVENDDVAPLLALPGSYDEYLSGLPGKLRHEIRRKARRLDAETGGHSIVLATEETLVEDLDCFVALHRSSEGPKGKFMQPGMEIFFRRLGETFLADGVFRLAFLEAEGEKLAGAIGFCFANRFYLYNSAYDHSRKDISPGMVLVADLIERAIEERCETFDMLKGDIPYKYRFGSRRRQIKRLVLTR